MKPSLELPLAGDLVTSSPGRIAFLSTPMLAYLPRSAGKDRGETVVFFLLVLLPGQRAAVLHRPQVVPHHKLGRGIDDVGGARLILVLPTRHQTLWLRVYAKKCKAPCTSLFRFFAAMEKFIHVIRSIAYVELGSKLDRHRVVSAKCARRRTVNML